MIQHTFFALILITALCSVVRAVDRTLEDGASGSDVVQAVIAKLDSSKIFDNDHRLLRRLAFVESSDGRNSGILGQPNGGIWDVEESKFDKLLTVPELAEARDSIWQGFRIVWAQVTRDDLRKPFYSGLAARLYLHYLEITGTASIPLAGNIEEQAQFWITYYRSNTGGMTTDYFVGQVTALDKREGCKVNADIFFVLDGSGSIGSSSFDQVRQFEKDFVKTLIIGPQDNQIGTIVFSSVGSVIFYLNSYNYTNDILNAIQAIPYPGGNTNTPDGLCQMVRHGFTEENGARPTSAAVMRIAIVMTDGQSNKQSSDCQWDTLQAAEAVHGLTPPVLVYAIGVTSNINRQELEAIATTPDDITYLSSFNKDILQEAQEEHFDEVCKKASIPASTDEEMNGTLDQNETVRYQFPVPVIGITVKVCVSVGHVIVYGSVSIPSPNSAFYDWLLELEFQQYDNEAEICKNVFFVPSKIPDNVPPKASSTISYIHPSTQPVPTRATTSSQVPQPSMFPYSGDAPGKVKLTDLTLYIAVVGKHDENSFVLNGTVGDIYHESDVSSSSSAGTAPSPGTSPSPGTAPTSTTDSESERMFIIVATSSSGLLLLAFSCILVLCCVCGCYIRQHKKKRGRVDQYSLLPQNIDYI